MTDLNITPLGYALGAEVRGLDLRETLDEETISALREAWLKHLVLVFPGQDIAATDHIRFAKCFGEVDKNEATPDYRDPEHPEILLITNKPKDGRPSETRNTGRNWHSDLSYTTRPALGSLLLCKERPEAGGDTMFANMYMAYDGLSDKMREIIEDLWAVHDVSFIKGLSERSPEKVAALKKLNPPVAHPVVRTHPETKRKLLFISERVSHFVGMTQEESAPLLSYLNKHAVQPEFVYRHRWNVHDLVMWENRSTMHLALADFDQRQPRHMMRCSLLGTPCGHVYESMDEKEKITAVN
jgi:taurine dioxygenase